MCTTVHSIRSRTGNLAPFPDGSSGRRVLLNLQLLRFVAALMVVLLHAVHPYRRMGGTLEGVMVFRHFGFAGVDIFFVLSGFIIWTTNLRTEGVAQIARYLYRRLVRIFLGHWPFFGLAIAVRAVWAPEGLAPVDYLRSFFLIPQRQAGQVLHVGWTLSFELYFYTLFFFVLFFRRRVLLGRPCSWAGLRTRST
jgi:peptidoglycan/LPS O-acetylase OafA/YrhL